ncbi:9768_t:CDS:2, partial [Racocetra persica]
MTRYQTRKHVKSNNSNLEDNLKKFLDEHIKFLQRDKRHVEKFFRINRIQGEDLKEKLNELQKIIVERESFKDKLNLYQITTEKSTKLIRKLHAEKQEFSNQIQQLKSENDDLKLQIDSFKQYLQYQSMLDSRTIENLQHDVNILESREEIFIEELQNRARLRREDVFVIHDDDNDNGLG